MTKLDSLAVSLSARERLWLRIYDRPSSLRCPGEKQPLRTLLACGLVERHPTVPDAWRTTPAGQKILMTLGHRDARSTPAARR